jgi:hypothetical protein
LIFIAEVKTKSPFGWISNRSWDELFILAASIGDWISVHTDPRWGGSLELLEKARSFTSKPILAKGIHASDMEVEEAFSAGADYVLVVGRISERPNLLLEPTTLDGLRAVPDGLRGVWNARDLSTGLRRPEPFSEAREAWPGWLCQASFVRSPADVHPEAEAVLVGEHLPSFR